MNEVAGLRVAVLGPVRAWRGPDELELGPARQRAVFAVLALRAGRPVTRAELVSAVWGLDAPKSVAGNIHTYVSGLRRVLEPDRDRWADGTLLTSDAAGYRLRVGTVDAVEFERGVRDADAGDTLDSVLALWRGDPLSGVPGPFADEERARLVELRLAALEHRASAVLAAGDHQELTAELTALAGEYPLRERLRELLMLALHRGGQRAEALEVYADTRRVLAAELGVEPGPALRDLHARLLREDPAPTRLLVLPPADRGPFVGRVSELRRLRTLVDAVCDGRGGAVWLEGEFGIGKSALLRQALAGAPDRGCQVGWAVADERSTRIPLRVMHDCLGVAARLPEVREAAAATADVLLGLVTELCSRAPLVLVVDDMQWADEASVLLWHRLTVAARGLPLLLIAAARPVPRGPTLVRLRHELHSRDNILTLGPLSDVDSLALAEQLTGAPAGPHLRALVGRTTGNPLYVKELTEALLRSLALVTADGVADLASDTYSAPRSLVDTLRRHLDVLSDEARAVLRSASLLGTEFTVSDIAAVAGKRPSELLAVFEEATTANVVVGSGDHLAFRHPLLRQASYDELPDRDELHRLAASALASAGAPVTRVAEQLAATHVTDAWVLSWLADNHEDLANHAPRLAADLLARAVSVCPVDDPRREVLAAAHVIVLFRLDQQPELAASEALAITTDPYRAGELRQLLASMRFRRGDVGAAIRTVANAADDPSVPELWRQRHRHLLASFRRGPLDDLAAAEAAGREALSEAAGDEYLTAHARQTLWLVATVRRDHEAALEHVDAALAAVRSVDVLADVELDLLDNRLFTCHNLDLLDEAERTLSAARALTRVFQVPSAVHHFWVGKWNEALVELDSVDDPALTFFGLRDPAAMALVVHGVAALIAGRRGDGIQAAAHLDAVAQHGPATLEERENVDFLLVAKAVAATQRGDRPLALALLDPLLDPTYAPMMLRHQWMPEVVRLACTSGDLDRARLAAAVCAGEAEKERTTGRATVASWWCQGMVARDPSPVLSAAAHYRRVGRRVELGGALEDAAVLLALRGDRAAAQAAFDECTSVYADMSARWDLDRAETRLGEFDIIRPLGLMP